MRGSVNCDMGDSRTTILYHSFDCHQGQDINFRIFMMQLLKLGKSYDRSAPTAAADRRTSDVVKSQRLIKKSRSLLTRCPRIICSTPYLDIHFVIQYGRTCQRPPIIPTNRLVSIPLPAMPITLDAFKELLAINSLVISIITTAAEV